MIRRHALAPQIGLEIKAHGPAARHFAAEYGDGRPGQEPAVIRLVIGLRSDRTLRAVGPVTLAFAGGHRFARWRVRVYLDAPASHVAYALTVAGRELVPVRTLLLSAGAKRGRVSTDELVRLAQALRAAADPLGALERAVAG